MARRLAPGCAALALVAFVLAACGDESPGLATLAGSGGGVGFELHCGETAHWEAAVIANDAKETATITSIRLAQPAAGFKLEWARAYRGAANIAYESRAKTSVLGLTLSPSHLSDDAKKDGETVGWHLVLGIRIPKCAARKGLRPGSSVPEHDYSSEQDGAVVGYRVGGHTRSMRIGDSFGICAVPRGFKCTPRIPR